MDGTIYVTYQIGSIMSSVYQNECTISTVEYIRRNAIYLQCIRRNVFVYYPGGTTKTKTNEGVLGEAN